jgi:predicted anti-sigma-YlaC factor YlaD
MKTFDEHLQTYLLDDPETSAPDRRAIESHLAGCADCRRSLESYRRARRLIASPKALESSPEFSKDFVERIFSKVDGNHEIAAANARRTRPWVLSAASALAAVLLAVAYFGFRAPEAAAPMTPVTQDLLAADDGSGFYEWATSPDNPSDDDVLKVVLEDL